MEEAFCADLNLNEKHVCCDSKSHFTPNLISLKFLDLLVSLPTLVLSQICADLLALTSLEYVGGRSSIVSALIGPHAGVCCV